MSETFSNELDIAKAIVELLAPLDPARKLRTLRFAAEVLDLDVASFSGDNSSRTSGAPGPQNPGHSVLDIAQFTAAKAPKSDMQFAAVAAYYLRFEAREGDRKDSIDI